jgi:paraquat-inducible protein B
MSTRASPRTIGVFVLSGLGLAVASVAVFGSGNLFSQTHQFVSFFDASVGGLGPGSAVKFRGVPVGTVEGVYLRLAEVPQDPTDNSIPVIFNIDADLIAGRGAVLDLGNAAAVDSLINTLGMSASLASESLVTGQQYVALDMYVARERFYVGTEGSGLIEIPTVRTGFEEIQSQLQDVISGVSSLDLAGLLEDVRGVIASVREQIEGGEMAEIGNRAMEAFDVLDLTLADIRGLVSAADSTLGPMAENLDESVELLRGTADNLDETLDTVQEAFEPDGTLLYRVDVALRDMAEAARSFRNLADYLERNPSALIRGRPDNQE